MVDRGLSGVREGQGTEGRDREELVDGEGGSELKWRSQGCQEKCGGLLGVGAMGPGQGGTPWVRQAMCRLGAAVSSQGLD